MFFRHIKKNEIVSVFFITHNCKNISVISLIKSSFFSSPFSGFLFSIYKHTSTEHRLATVKVFYNYFFILIWYSLNIDREREKKVSKNGAASLVLAITVELLLNFDLFGEIQHRIVSSCAHKMHAMIVASVKHVHARECVAFHQSTAVYRFVFNCF